MDHHVWLQNMLIKRGEVGVGRNETCATLIAKCVKEKWVLSLAP